MKTANKRFPLFICIFIAALILPIIIYSSVQIYLLLTFDKEEYVISVMEERYNSEFICEGKNEIKDADDTVIFTLKPSAKPELTVTATFCEKAVERPIFPVLFSHQRIVEDDFFEQIMKETVEGELQLPYALSDSTVDTAAKELFSIKEKVYEQKIKYVKTEQLSYVDDYFTVDVTYKGEKGEITLDSRIREQYIKNQIEAFIENNS